MERREVEGMGRYNAFKHFKAYKTKTRRCFISRSCIIHEWIAEELETREGRGEEESRGDLRGEKRAEGRGIGTEGS